MQDLGSEYNWPLGCIGQKGGAAKAFDSIYNLSIPFTTCEASLCDWDVEATITAAGRVFYHRISFGVYIKLAGQ